MSERVILANINGGEHVAAFTQSLVDTIQASPGRFEVWLQAGLYVPEQRDSLAMRLLNHSDADWLCFIDSDMEWTPGELDQLVASADATERPIIGALCYSPYFHFAMPVGWVPGPGGVPARIAWDATGIVQVHRTGTAFLMIHRDVLARIRENAGGCFRQGYTSWGAFIGEDLWFCDRAREAGYPIHINCDVKVRHWKRVPVGEAMAGPQPVRNARQMEELARGGR